MEHIVAAGNGLWPAFIRIEVRSEESDAIGTGSRAALPQHGAHVVFTRQVADRRPHLMPSRQQLD
jgi:hypothetical protein